MKARLSLIHIYSHPVVLFAYFLSVITLTIIQQNYYLIILSIVSAIIIDYYFNYLTFFKDMKYTVVLVVIIMITNPLFVTEGFDIWFQNDYVTITKDVYKRQRSSSSKNSGSNG